MTLHRIGMKSFLKSLDRLEEVLREVPPNENSLLQTLIEAPRGHFISRTKLIGKIYGLTEPDDANGCLNIYIMRLRKKGFLIDRRHSFGYRLNGDMREIKSWVAGHPTSSPVCRAMIARHEKQVAA